MRGAQVATAVVVTAAAAGVAWTKVAVYRAERGPGSCGGGFLATPVLSDIVCAMKCARNVLCGGFSFMEDVTNSQGICRLHENLTPPDGDPRTTCFVFDTTTTTTPNVISTTTTDGSSNTAPTDSASTNIASITAASATTASTNIASTNTTSTTSASTTSASSTTISTTIAQAITASTTSTSTPSTTTASFTPPTTASTTTTPATSAVTSTTASVWNFNDVSSVLVSGHCANGSGVVGFSLEGSWFHIIKLLCLSPPAGLAFTTPTTTEECTSSNIRDCMTKSCPSGTVYMGPKTRWMAKSLHSCSGGFTSAVATLDTTDCHVVEGDLQLKPAVGTSGWVQWRYCEGNSTAFYVMTEAVVTGVSDILSDLTSIKCCRVKPL